eukprot:SAG11_NODE_29578_length_309_cov_1.080952_1_plen_23_part_10
MVQLELGDERALRWGAKNHFTGN